MDTDNRTIETQTARASDSLGAVRKLPSVAFRGIACDQLAEQYRQVRALEALGVRQTVGRI